MVHFVLLAFAIFILYQVVAPPATTLDTIVVTAQDINSLKAKFRTTWGREPSPSELAEDVDRFVRAEIYYREAIAMGLDRNDQVVRARMGQKIEFMLSDPAGVPTPTDAELRAFYEATAGNYAVPDRVSFLQVFLGNPAPGAAEAALGRLRAGQNPENVGVGSLLPARMDAASPAAVDNAFGKGFFQQLMGEPVGGWAGPISSTFGEHLINVTAVTASQQPEFQSLRDEIEADWRRDAARKAADSAYQRLKARYRIDLSEAGLSG
jgi:hypothetical protein